MILQRISCCLVLLLATKTWFDMAGFESYCTGCGACCVFAYRTKGFPQDLLVPGGEMGLKCKHFVNGRCAVYNNRPDICNVNKQYYVHTKKGASCEGMTKNQFFSLQTQACQVLQDELLIDKNGVKK